jgi:ComF family protein
MDRLVRRFKFAGDLALGRWLGEAVAIAARDEPRPSLLVVPASTRERLRQRGFNPALEIAKATARILDIECARGALERTRETQPQPGLGRRERRRNLEGAFACERDLRGMHVAIVDDVMTTGATIDAAASALRRAGAARVSAWVAARTPPPFHP